MPQVSKRTGEPIQPRAVNNTRDSDIIAVDRAGKRRLRRAVLAVVEGAVTAKIQRKREGRFYLATANSREGFPDIELTEDSESGA